MNGLVLNGVVESVEDKGIIPEALYPSELLCFIEFFFSDMKFFSIAGVIINLGLQSLEIKGFLAEKYLPATFRKENLLEGQPLLLRIQNESLSNEVRCI